MGVSIYCLEFMFTLMNILQQQKLMKKDILTEILFLNKKDKKHQKKKLKFIRINTSNVKNDCDLDCEVGNIETFIDELKNKKIKELEKNKRNVKLKNKKLNKLTNNY